MLKELSWFKFYKWWSLNFWNLENINTFCVLRKETRNYKLFRNKFPLLRIKVKVKPVLLLTFFFLRTYLESKHHSQEMLKKSQMHARKSALCWDTKEAFIHTTETFFAEGKCCRGMSFLCCKVTCFKKNHIYVKDRIVYQIIFVSIKEAKSLSSAQTHMSFLTWIWLCVKN